MVDHQLFIASSYLFLGGGIKYIDQAYDLGVFSKTKAKIVAVLCGILMGYLIVTDSPSMGIFLAMVLALAITRKIDNMAFYIGTGLVILLPVFFNGFINILWLPFGVLTVSGVLDELGNDWADKRINRRLVEFTLGNGNGRMTYKFMEKFFFHRFSMKVAVMLLVFFSFMDLTYLLAFILFDLMYTLVEVYSFSIKVYTINKMPAGY
ncbi:MAG: hypothetical protein JW724_04845 [Candidatus Altiarchaeota archaeon]|nr:hypothetical protein [Candidatus Altiarchaeota archaeon]